MTSKQLTALIIIFLYMVLTVIAAVVSVFISIRIMEKKEF